MLKILRYLFSFLRSVVLFESNKPLKINKKFKKNFKLIIVKFLKKNKNSEILKYFDVYEFKKKRFKKKQFFIALLFKKKLLCSGWYFIGKEWYISEVDTTIRIKNSIMLFDFETPEGERNKGNYTTILKFIRNKFKLKKLLIYSLGSNHNSIKGITKAGFHFKKKISKFKKL
tara:strand:- start:28 stop:543 length:516 start_codon:yes stop_codon:yes gene_type:complete